MIASIELAVCCTALVTGAFGPGPGGDSLPLEALSEAEAESYMSKSLFAAESILMPGNSHIAIGPASGPPAALALNDWTAGTTYGWLLSWDPLLQELAFEVRESATDTELVSWNMPVDAFAGLLFTARVKGASVSVNNWVLDGVPLDTDLYADTTASRMDLLLQDGNLENTWKLKGDIIFDWAGSFPDSGVGSFAIYGISVPAPSAVLLLLAPLTAFTRRRTRS